MAVVTASEPPDFDGKLSNWFDGVVVVTTSVEVRLSSEEDVGLGFLPNFGLCAGAASESG